MSIAAGDETGLWIKPLKISCVIIPILAVLVCIGLVASTDEPRSAGEDGSGTATVASEVGKSKPKIEFTPGVEPNGLEKKDLVVGTGAKATSGTEVTVHYIVALNKNGKEVESSWGRAPYIFELGSGQVAAGWERGIEGMKEGGRRELVAPSELAFGKAGVKGVIAPNEDLLYVIDLVKVRLPPVPRQGQRS
jgi:peptidylprolyl isomerase